VAVTLVTEASVVKADRGTICVRFTDMDLSTGDGMRLLEELYTRLSLHPDFINLGSDKNQVTVCHLSKRMQPNLVAKLVRATARTVGFKVRTSTVA
jgi:hypothetical protein